MNCREARTMMPLLDREDLDAPERRELTAHAEGCPACASELERVRESVDLLRVGAADLLSMAPPAAELEQMLAGVEPNGRRRVPWVALAAAAVLLLAAIPAALHYLEGSGEPAPVDRQASQEETEPKPEIEEKPVEKKVAESPELIMKAAMFLKNTREWKQAEERFRQVIEASKTQDEIVKYAIPARMQIAECLYRREKFRRSYEEYGRVVAEHREEAPEVAADAAYYRYRAATALAAKTKDQKDLDLKAKARDAFRRGFPDHPRAIDLSYYHGADLVASADVEKMRGKTDEATELYEKAIADGFDRVKPKSVLWAKARARKAETYFKMGRYDEAVSMAMDVLSEKGWQKTTDPRRLDNRKQAKATAAFYGALALREEKQWEDVLRMLESFTDDSKDRMVRLFRHSVRVERIRALLALGRVDEAVAQVRLIVEETKTLPAKLQREIRGTAAKLLADAIKAQKDEKARQALADALDLVSDKLKDK